MALGWPTHADHGRSCCGRWAHFTVDAEARLSAHATSGAALWSIDLTPQGEGKGEATGAGIAYGNGTLFVTTAYGVLHAINPTNGAIRWSQSLRGAGTRAHLL